MVVYSGHCWFIKTMLIHHISELDDTVATWGRRMRSIKSLSKRENHCLFHMTSQPLSHVCKTFIFTTGSSLNQWHFLYGSPTHCLQILPQLFFCQQKATSMPVTTSDLLQAIPSKGSHWLSHHWHATSIFALSFDPPAAFSVSQLNCSMPVPDSLVTAFKSSLLVLFCS